MVFLVPLSTICYFWWSERFNVQYIRYLHTTVKDDIMIKKRKMLISAAAAIAIAVPTCTALSAAADQVDEYWLWQRLIDNGLTEAGAAGVLGNIKAESNFLSENLQDSYEADLGYDDWEYVHAVDWGWYDNFVYDQAGFGLPQFTFPARKLNFYNTAQSVGASIADVDLQVNFMMYELKTEYPGVLDVLRTTGNVYEATSTFMCEYENPADQSYDAINFRYKYAYSYYDSYAQGLAVSSTSYYSSITPSYSSYTYEPVVSYNNSSDYSVGDTVLFTGINHHISAWDDSYGSYCGAGIVQITAICLGSPYSVHAVAVDGSPSDCYGWVSPSEISYDISSAPVAETNTAPVEEYSKPQTVQPDDIKVGDIMMFNGSTHHYSAFDSTGGSYCTSGKVRISEIYSNGTYQYHAVSVDGGTCCGWVSIYDLSPVSDSAVVTETVYETAPAVCQPTDIQVGSTVYFYGGAEYAWSNAAEAADYPPAGTAIVTDIIEGSAHPYHIIHSDGSSWVYGYCDASSIELLY